MNKKIAVVFISAGREDLLKKTWESFTTNVIFPYEYDLFSIDDCPDTPTRAFIDTWPNVKKIHHKSNEGLGSSINDMITTVTDADYVFHMEDDFTFNRKVSIQNMINILDSDEKILQLKLTRQPVYPIEITAGNCITPHGFKYEQKDDHILYWGGWSFNPNLARGTWYSKVNSVALVGVEADFGAKVKSGLDDTYRTAFLGKLSDTHWVNHIGGYRKVAKF